MKLFGEATAVAGIVLATALISTPGIANASTFQNGDFESPAITSAFINYSDGSTAITGWTVSAPSGTNVALINASRSGYSPAASGNQWLDLTGSGALGSEGVTQTFDTVSGHQYQVTFGIGASTQTGSTKSIVNPYINGNAISGAFQLAATSSSLIWQDFNFDFTATGGSTTIGFFNGDTTGGSLNGLDNVRISDLGVATTPLPASLPLFATGLGGLGFLAFGKKKKAFAAAA